MRREPRFGDTINVALQPFLFEVTICDLKQEAPVKPKPPPRRKGLPVSDCDLVASSEQDSTTSKVGDKVAHEKFDPGTVAAIDGNKLAVDLFEAGRKRAVESFVSLG